MSFLLSLLVLCNCRQIIEFRRPLINKDYFTALEAEDITSFVFNESTFSLDGYKAMAELGTYSKLHNLTIIDQYLPLSMCKELANIKAPVLSQLTIKLTTLGHQGFQLLANAGILQNLTLLELASDQLNAESIEHLCSINLSNIQTLSLSGNSIGSEGYRQLIKCQVPKLKNLLLSETNMTKQGLLLFTQWNITHIQRLQLRGNQLSDDQVVQLFAMPWKNLRKLSLSRSNISARTPFDQLHSLASLQCQQCIFEQLSLDLPNLEQLIINGGNVDQEVVEKMVKKLPKLRTLKVRNAMLRFFSFLRSVPDQLEELLLMGNYLKADEHIRQFRRLTKLRKLSLDDNDLNDAAIAQTISYAKFEQLSLSQLAVAEYTLKVLGQIDTSSLQLLHLSRCPFANRIVLVGKKQFPKLKLLDLSQTLLKDDAFQFMSVSWKIPNIEQLNLAGCYMSDSALLYLSKFNLSKLKILEIQEGTMTGQAFSQFEHNALQSLEQLTLSEVSPTIDGFRALSRLNLTSLTTIKFVDSKLTDDHMIALIESAMPRLSSLYIVKNEVGDKFIKEMVKKAYRNLTTLAVAFNYVGDEGFRLILNNMPYLRSLGVGGPALTANALVSCKPQFTKYIKQIVVRYSGLEDDFLENLKKLTSKMDNLLRLDLSYNSIGDKGAKALSSIGFPSLRHLFLNRNEIQDSGFTALFEKSFETLKIMVIDVAKVSPVLLVKYKNRVKYLIENDLPPDVTIH